ncbi:MAG: class I SAM-dependent methyltransferase [Rhodospirillaceae bacterium]|nr:class I SAM-dependent methyltransferase [Rhodospirillaceae bacterium]
MGVVRQIDRGWIGRLERPPALDAETYAGFCEGMRGFIFGPLGGKVKQASDAAINRAKAAGRDLARVNDIRALFDPIPVVAARNRLLRSAQEMMWRRYREAYDDQAYLDELAAYDAKGPGSVEWDPNFAYPAYVKHPIHIQPGGYGGDPLCGYWYHQASNVFFIGANDQDEYHLSLAAATRPPADGKVDRVIDLGCSIGQLTVGLKERFKNAAVTGLDVASAQVRYAHMRAAKMGVECHFVQRLAEDTRYPDGHFDVVAAFLLFHEVSLEAGEKIVREAYRILRPGGVFNIFDFPTGLTGDDPYFRYFMDVDSKDNCEPYSVDYTGSDFVGLLKRVGFKVEMGTQDVMLARTYYATK